MKLESLARLKDRVFCYATTPDLHYFSGEWYPARLAVESRWERGWHYRLDRRSGVRVPVEVERLVREPVIVIGEHKYTLADAPYLLRHFCVPSEDLPQYERMWRLLELVEYVFHFDLKPFQQREVAKALARRHGILAFDPGLGKTASALAFAAACTVLPRWNALPRDMQRTAPLGVLATKVFCGKFSPRVLIVAPGGLLEQWRQEARKFLGLDLLVVERHSEARALPKAFWAITHYDALSRRGDGKLYKHFPPVKALIFDEIHHIKNDSLRSRAARALRGKFRLGLSATLLERPWDIFWPTWVICGPRCFGYTYSGRKRFIAESTPRVFPVQDGRRQGRGFVEKRVCNPLPLWRALAHTSRVTLEDVGNMLVPYERKVVTVPFGEEQRESYLAWLERFAEYVEEKHPDLGWSREQIASRGALLGQDAFLHQACILPSQLPRWGSTDWTPKNTAVVDLAEEMVSQGHQVVIFSIRKLAGKLFAEALQRRGIPAGHILSGERTLSPPERMRVVRAFKDGELRVLCATPQALGEGYNLVEASVVIMQSFSFAYSALAQALGRVRRLTSPKPIQAFIFVTQDSLEEIILQRLGEKEHLDMLATRLAREEIQKAIEKAKKLMHC